MRAILLSLLVSSSFAKEEERQFAPYTPPGRLFSCEIPAKGWQAYEHETPRGSSVHILGPALAGGSLRAAYHIHFFDKSKPGFVAAEETLRMERERDKDSEREATPPTVTRIQRAAARLFEVRERRIIPGDRLPASPLVLHHYYAMLPAGDGYFMIKLSTTQEDYLDYRKEFKRFLGSFRVLGYQ